jgi:signal transduction histidine kinase
MRRLLGPVSGPFMFFLVAALVFAGLGWVTVAALRVETAQREAAAQAELGNNLRVALWRLDGRMLPALGVEDSRPFYHYSSPDPLNGSTVGPTPLVAAPLPEWMKLHVQLDPTNGWDSPQVLTPDACVRVNDAWPDLPLGNVNNYRAETLNSMRAKYPSRSTLELLAARERANTADNRPFAVPLVDPQTPSQQQQQSFDWGTAGPPNSSVPKPPPPPEMGPVSTPGERSSESFRIFGWDLPRRDTLAGNYRSEDRVQSTITNTPKDTQAKPPAFPPVVPPPGGAVGRTGFPPLNDIERQWSEFRNRTKTTQNAMDDAKRAGQEFPQYNRGGQQGGFNNPVDGKGQFGNGINIGNGQTPNGPAPSAPGLGVPVPGGAPPNSPFSKNEKDKDAKASEMMKSLRTEQFRGTLFEHLATLSLGLERRRCLDEIQQPSDDNRKQPFADDERPLSILDAAWGVAMAASGNKPPRLVPPAEERPIPVFNTFNNGQQNNWLSNTSQLPFAGRATNIHLGSMRPQWITAADGTETLVLVRAANIDGKTVYQGVVLDWAKLEQVLKDEVADLFPDAKLVPVRDAASVSPDRAMTALPVQLDPGTTPELPPAGWTPLRIGLVLAWVAALVAFAAVGFSGWSLIDLAERRIRFVSAVTHELRTPLTSLRLYLDLLMSGMIHDEAKRQEYLNTLATESDRLHRLIDNVLDFAKLEKRAKNGDMKPLNVGELLDQLRSTWTDRVAADGKELIVISTLPAETEVVTDAAMVQQIIANLIDNARKYTRDAEDKRIWLWAKPGGNGRVVFEVEDRGCGVSPSERKSIFKPFRRGVQADAKAGGAGLGLALAKQWAEVLGGTVAYRPAEGAPGACFRLELPVK